MDAPQQGTPAPPGRAWAWPAFALLAALSLLLIAPCHDASFSGRDDNRYVVKNPVARGEVPLLKALAYNELELYQPLVLLSHRLEWSLFASLQPAERRMERWAILARALNLLFHVLAGLALWRWALPRLGLGGAGGFFVTALFLLHPVQCENVCWIAERKAILSGLFSMLAFACYLRGRGERAETAAQEPGFRIELRGQHLTLAAVCFGLALSAKVSAVGMLGVLAGWELLLGPDHLEGRTGAGKKLAACAARAGVPLLLALPFLAANWLAARESFGRLLGGSAWGVLIGDLAIAGRYAEVLAWPTSSSPYYAFVPPESLFEARVLLGLGILAAALALTLVLPVEREARRRAAFGWIWCFGAMVTYLNFVPNPEYLHDRYLYLSLPGLGLALLEAARGLAARLRLPAAKLAWPLALGLAALWSALSARESAHWRSDYHLFSHAVAQEPESSHARGYLGLHLGTLALHEHREAGAFAPPGAEPAPSAQAQAWREEALAELERAMACPDIAWNVRRLHFRLAQVVILKDLGRVEASRLKVREMHAEADRNGWDTAPDRSFLARARAIWRDMYPESQARE